MKGGCKARKEWREKRSKGEVQRQGRDGGKRGVKGDVQKQGKGWREERSQGKVQRQGRNGGKRGVKRRVCV